MSLKPDARNLLETALALFRTEILRAVPADKRYAALMIANALAMAEREIGAPGLDVQALSATLYADAPMWLEDFERRLAADIEAGEFDAAGPRRDAAFAAIRTINAARLAITNPKLLAGTS